MKKVKVDKVYGIRRSPLSIAAEDSLGNLVYEGDEPSYTCDKCGNAPRKIKIVDATVIDVVKMLILRHPAQTLTRQDSIHGDRLWDQMEKTKTNGVLHIEDAEWDWLMKKLQDDAVGAKIFGTSIYRIEQSIKDLVVDEETKKQGNSKD